jgi:hypothetical protein
LISLAGIACCFGSDADAKAIENVFTARVRPGVKKINQTLTQGGDPKEIEVSELWAAAIRARNGGTRNNPHISSHTAHFLLSSNMLVFARRSLIDFCYSDCQVLWHQLHEDRGSQSLQERHST